MLKSENLLIDRPTNIAMWIS